MITSFFRLYHRHSIVKSVLVVLAITSSICSFADIRYVKPVASGTGDGSSWANASDDLQGMINASSGFDQVWVAAGTYIPTNTGDRTISFQMKRLVAIFGGFPALGNPTMADRDRDANATILSGDLLGNDGPGFANNSDNSYHVFSHISPGSSGYYLFSEAVLDGFIIRGGNANGAAPDHDSGGGMYNSGVQPTIRNCTFEENYATTNGGAMVNLGSYVYLENCEILNNSAGVDGGGIYTSGSLEDPTNCTFSGNTAGNNGGAIANVTNCFYDLTKCSFKGNSAANFGGAVYNVNLSLIPLVNCVFLGNTAVEGGAVYNGSQCYSDVTNCTFSGNDATIGGAMHNSYIWSSYISNSIFWGNSSEMIGTGAITYSIVQGGFTGTGNLNVDPLFVSQPPIGLGTVGDLHLQAGSPAIDMGTPSDDAPIDREGKPRPTGTGFDMGAYESGDPCFAGGIIYVNDDAAGNNDGSSWVDAFNDLQKALLFSDHCSNLNEIWVAAGTYIPTNDLDSFPAFQMQNGLAIYGGFAGAETMLHQRDVSMNTSLLSGDLVGDDGPNFTNISDNSFNVIRNENIDHTAVLDGFTISGGAARSDHLIKGTGGGMYNYYLASPTVRNCSFVSNAGGGLSAGGSSMEGGGGMHNSFNSSPLVDSCMFMGNLSNKAGGAIYNSSGSPVISNCSFVANELGVYTGTGFGARGGAAIYNASDTLTLSNSTFMGNDAVGFGGGIRSQYSVARVTNCQFSGNRADHGAGIAFTEWNIASIVNCSFSGNQAAVSGGAYYNENNTAANIVNSTMWGNSSEIVETGFFFSLTVSHSIVDGGYAGTANLNMDPLFVSQPPIGLGTTGDLNLQAASPAIDAADYNAYDGGAVDLDGNSRTDDDPATANTGIGTVSFLDRGAFEFQASLPAVQVDVKAFLEGPYQSATSNMTDQLRTSMLIQSTEPYTALGYVHVEGSGEGVIGAAFGFDVVDWVVVELRDPSDPTVLVATKNAFLLKDGMIKDVDGFSTLAINVTPGAYYLSLRHRNHFGVMTAAPISLNTTPVSIDFTDPATLVWGVEATKDIGGTKVLWAGDVNFDGQLKYVGAANDRDPILVEIGGSVPTNTTVGYEQEDVNMDGSVKYVGANNDRDPILINIGGSVPTNSRVEQLP